MTIQFNNPDRPNSYIGKTVPRPNATKLVQGRGRYVDDIVLPRMLHVAFARSPLAHAKIQLELAALMTQKKWNMEVAKSESKRTFLKPFMPNVLLREIRVVANTHEM